MYYLLSPFLLHQNILHNFHVSTYRSPNSYLHLHTIIAIIFLLEISSVYSKGCTILIQHRVIYCHRRVSNYFLLQTSPELMIPEYLHQCRNGSCVEFALKETYVLLCFPVAIMFSFFERSGRRPAIQLREKSLSTQGWRHLGQKTEHLRRNKTDNPNSSLGDWTHFYREKHTPSLSL